ncbi:MAG: hypothetical protein ACI8XC_003633 [Gammaproteobacteria bacterium]|jgi:hypothetical protein
MDRAPDGSNDSERVIMIQSRVELVMNYNLTN